MKKLMTSIAVAGIVMYPFLVYIGMNWYEPRIFAVILCILLLVRTFSSGSFSRGRINYRSDMAVVAVPALVIILYTLGSNQLGGLKLYPVIVSFSLLAVFAYSLIHSPTVIERIARRTTPGLSEAGVKYTRMVTILWCGFFLLNGIIALYTSIFASIEAWTIYNGFVSYLIIGSLLGGEYLYRHLNHKN